MSGGERDSEELWLASGVQRAAGMLPRPVFPGENVLITRRCTQRTFLLRPDEETNQTYLYVLGLAAQRTGVGLVIAVTMSNHEHVGTHDGEGRRVESRRIRS